MMKVKVFLSWSGATSKALAEALRSWLPSVIDSIEPYFSPDDIEKGSRWSNEIAKALEETKIGLICLTEKNLKSPWIMFETGALSKIMQEAKVCLLLFGIEPSKVEKGPLGQFQAAVFSREEMMKVMKMVNHALGPYALSPQLLNLAFEKKWPKLEKKVKKILEEPPPPSEVHGFRDLFGRISKEEWELISKKLSGYYNVYYHWGIANHTHKCLMRIIPLENKLKAEIVECFFTESINDFFIEHGEDIFTYHGYILPLPDAEHLIINFIKKENILYSGLSIDAFSIFLSTKNKSDFNYSSIKKNGKKYFCGIITAIPEVATNCGKAKAGLVNSSRAVIEKVAPIDRTIPQIEFDNEKFGYIDNSEIDQSVLSFIENKFENGVLSSYGE